MPVSPTASAARFTELMRQHHRRRLWLVCLLVVHDLFPFLLESLLRPMMMRPCGQTLLCTALLVSALVLVPSISLRPTHWTSWSRPLRLILWSAPSWFQGQSNQEPLGSLPLPSRSVRPVELEAPLLTVMTRRPGLWSWGFEEHRTTLGVRERLHWTMKCQSFEPIRDDMSWDLHCPHELHVRTLSPPSGLAAPNLACQLLWACLLLCENQDNAFHLRQCDLQAAVHLLLKDLCSSPKFRDVMNWFSWQRLPHHRFGWFHCLPRLHHHQPNLLQPPFQTVKMKRLRPPKPVPQPQPE